ncbi:hypothetical protein G0Q06_11815 [Puniceicoccales bacterium CK1056]|uniref:Uncharacterized protein n=1 Tax=Oceanipulchritudo coccoides TaxID=2706888 RepID=A0A6B2M2A4_9BACT|nr:hypothetical protein [Oceanipulchritudo coccoides]NDV63141.1 hypothetical protein [Oceanipulchritudo coccoides]
MNFRLPPPQYRPLKLILPFLLLFNGNVEAHHTGELYVERGPFRIIADYSMDSSGFFTTERRTTVQAVFHYFEHYLHTSFHGLGPYGNNTWSWRLYHPSTGELITMQNPTAYNDTIFIYLGARELGGYRLAQGGHVSAGAYGSSEFLSLINERNSTELFIPWAGTISLNSTLNWHAPPHPYDPQSFSAKHDLFSTISHELCHVLGIGSKQCRSWNNDTNNLNFTGAATMDCYGGPIPLDSSGSHWDVSVKSTVWSWYEMSQQTLVSTSTQAGKRLYMTDLDWMALRDLGHEVWKFPQNLLWYPKSGPLPDLLGDLRIRDNILRLEFLTKSAPSDLWAQNMGRTLTQAFYRPIAEVNEIQPGYYKVSYRVNNGDYRIHLYSDSNTLLRARDGKGDQPHVFSGDWQASQSFAWHQRAGYYFIGNWPWVYLPNSSIWAYAVVSEENTYLYDPESREWNYTNSSLAPWMYSLATHKWKLLN